MTQDETITEQQLPQAMAFCQPRLLAGPGYYFSRYKSRFLTLVRKVKRLKRPENQLKAMNKWLEVFRKQRKGFSISPLNGNYPKEWLQIKDK